MITMNFTGCSKLRIKKNTRLTTTIYSHQQKGMALLMAIMIVALVAIISVNMLTQRQLQIYRTSNLYFREQAYQYSLAIERWGISVLSQDLEREKNDNHHFDSHQDIWNTALLDFDVEQATIDGVIFDLQGRFNLNNLVVNGKVQKKWEFIYKRLLNSLDLPSSLSNTLIDWMDADEQPFGSSGAEDIYYIALDNAYRTSNQPLVNVSELLLIKGYDQQVIETLKPYVFVAQEETPININTSTTIVLQAIIPGLSAAQAESLMDEIKKKPFAVIDDFLQHPTINDKAIEANHVSVISNYYTVTSNVIIDKTEVNLQSIISRDKQDGIRIVNRQESLWYERHFKKETTE